MTIVHTLKDGTIINDITNHIVKYEDCPEFYDCVLNFYNKKLNEIQEISKKEIYKNE